MEEAPMVISKSDAEQFIRTLVKEDLLYSYYAQVCARSNAYERLAELINNRFADLIAEKSSKDKTSVESKQVVHTESNSPVAKELSKDSLPSGYDEDWKYRFMPKP